MTAVKGSCAFINAAVYIMTMLLKFPMAYLSHCVSVLKEMLAIVGLSETLRIFTRSEARDVLKVLQSTKANIETH